MRFFSHIDIDTKTRKNDYSIRKLAPFVHFYLSQIKKRGYLEFSKITLTSFLIAGKFVVNHKLSVDIGRKEIDKNIQVLLKLL